MSNTELSYVWLAGDPAGPELANWHNIQGSDDLECPSCGQAVFLPGLDSGLFYETDPVPCPACGNVLSVGVDEDEATVIEHDRTWDFGQPACDGSGEGCIHPKTGPRQEFAGAKCDWECCRVDRMTMTAAMLERFGVP